MENLIAMLILIFSIGDPIWVDQPINHDEDFVLDLFDIDEIVNKYDQEKVVIDGVEFTIIRFHDVSFRYVGYGIITTKNYILFGSELSNSSEEKSIILHEIGHYFTSGVDVSKSINPLLSKEILADQWAVNHGAKPEDIINVLRKYGKMKMVRFINLIRIINLAGMEKEASPIEIHQVKLE